MGRWLQKIQKRTDTVPTKPTKAGFVGFVGSPPARFQKKQPAQLQITKRQVLAFTIDGAVIKITAIDTVATSQAEALSRLRDAWGIRLDSVWSADGHLIWERGCTC